jgi:hypothetical protein
MPRPAKSKYTPSLLIRAFKIAACARNDMLKIDGFTDNGGAIHSATRILDILGQRLTHPGLSHLAGLKNAVTAVFSEAALEAFEKGDAVEIEHINPLRQLTQQTIAKLDAGAKDDELLAFVAANYKLALLTKEERRALDKIDRIGKTKDRESLIKKANRRPRREAR